MHARLCMYMYLHVKLVSCNLTTHCGILLPVAADQEPDSASDSKLPKVKKWFREVSIFDFFKHSRFHFCSKGICKA